MVLPYGHGDAVTAHLMFAPVYFGRIYTRGLETAVWRIAQKSL